MSNYDGSIKTGLDQLTDLGAKEGRENRPSTADQNPDENEVRVLALTRECWNKVQASIRQQLQRLMSDIRKNAAEIPDIQARCDSVLQHPSTESRMQEEKQRHKRALIQLRKRELELLANLRWYREKNGVVDAAIYPDHLLFGPAVILFAIACETCLNAFFFADANGLIGGAIVAFGVSVLNLGLAGFLGFHFRYKNLPELKEKVFGWSMLALAFLALPMLNIVIAGYRAHCKEIVDPNDAKQVVDAFNNAIHDAARIFSFQSPFTQFEGLILFGVGLLLCVAAFYKGYGLDDKYPDHGTRDRMYKRAGQDYREELDRYCDSTRKAFDELKGRIYELRDSLVLLKTRASQHRRSVEDIRSESLLDSKRINDDYRLVIESYRRRNAVVRTSPPPAYFSEMLEVADIESLALDFRTVEEVVDKGEREASVVYEGQLPRVVSQIEHLQSTMSVELGDGVREFETVIKKEAEIMIAEEQRGI